MSEHPHDLVDGLARAIFNREADCTDPEVEERLWRNIVARNDGDTMWHADARAALDHLDAVRDDDDDPCHGTGWVPCWNPGGPCSDRVCELCGPCRTCDPDAPTVVGLVIQDDNGGAA